MYAVRPTVGILLPNRDLSRAGRAGRCLALSQSVLESRTGVANRRDVAHFDLERRNLCGSDLGVARCLVSAFPVPYAYQAHQRARSALTYRLCILYIRSIATCSRQQSQPGQKAHLFPIFPLVFCESHLSSSLECQLLRTQVSTRAHVLFSDCILA